MNCFGSHEGDGIIIQVCVISCHCTHFILLQILSSFFDYQDAAMVIITILVTKMYFPSWLEPREEPATRLNHSYLNVMDDAYKSDFSDEEDKDNDDEDEEEGGSTEDEDGEAEESGLLDDSEGVARSSRRVHRKFSNASSLPLEFDQTSQSKQSVYTNLAICAVMLNLTFVSWGILQVSS